MQINNLDIVRQCLDYYIFKKEDLKTISLYQALDQDNYKYLLENYNDLKRNTHSIIDLYNVHIISLGQSCLPHSVSVRTGLKLPRYLSNEPFGFFDASSTNIKSTNIILKNQNSYLDLCDTINDYKQYASNKYNFLYNHDTYDKHKVDIDKFNNILNTRLMFTKKMLSSGNCLCFIAIVFDNEDSEEDLKELTEVILNFNLTNKIIIIDTIGKFYCRKKLIQNYYHIPFPSSQYIWWKPEHYITQSGFDFMSLIASTISNFITCNFIKYKLFSSKIDSTKDKHYINYINTYKENLQKHSNSELNLFKNNEKSKMDYLEQTSLIDGISIRYIRKLAKFSCRFLIVVFSGFDLNSSSSYDFNDYSLINLHSHIIWIKDNFFENYCYYISYKII